IDLGQYLRVLLRWSWLIVALAVLGAVLGLIFAITHSPAYESEARLLVKPSPENISINTQNSGGPRIDVVLAQLLVPNVPVRSIAALSVSSTVENLVQQRMIQDMGDRFPQNLRRPGALLGLVSVQEVGGGPNILTVTVVHRDPEITQKLANTWASVATEYMNQTLGEGYFDAEAARKTLPQIQEQWNQNQQALNDFERTSDLTSIASRSASREALLSDYQRQSNQIAIDLSTAALLSDQLGSGGGNQASALAVQLLTLSAFTAEASRVELVRFLPPIESRLQGQSGDSGGLAVVPSQSDAVQVQPTLDQIGALPPAQQRAFVLRLSRVLTRRQTELQRSITALEKEVSMLRSRLEEATSQRDQRVVDRNAYRTTYESLNTLIRQQQVTGEIQSEKITVADPAITANRTDMRGLLPPALGVVFGLALGTLLAFVLEFSRGPRQVPRARSVPTTG
ncbi:MAG: Wzz/FepE/Etk N-terminal domain-containing protein, partial [Chloroflexota bacterium]|nr:Wzz/FepE/Etk N-terminal domain-containing protein [Chloroflexota bacterium]